MCPVDFSASKQVINNEKITTTDTRAKEVRKFVEKMITYGKKGDLVSRRKALAFLHNDKATVEKIFNDLAKRYENREGGYTQILKLAERRGDNSLMVILKLVDEAKPVEEKKGLWRYRIGNYRLIVENQGNKLIILILTFGYRKEIYK